MEKDAYYFPHFCNARHDRKIMRLRKELGVEGYGIFFMLLEILREQIDFRYPMKDIDLLADECGCSEQKLRVVICNYHLFQVDPEEQFFSPKLIVYLEPYLNMKEQRRLAGIKSGEVRRLKAGTTVEQPLNENEQSKVKESKVNKTKEKESKDIGTSPTHKFIIPTLEDIKTYCNERNNQVDADKFIDFYSSKGWMIGKNKMKDWKAAVRTWEKDKPTQQQPKQTYQQGNNKREYKDVEALLGMK